ncbi:MAG: copper chaperone PCu(A)C [Rhodospirillales bacterium]|nr:copper chaperone PCu(A)C [Rhodospirillales bacterium]
MRSMIPVFCLFVLLVNVSPANADNHMHPKIGDLTISHIWSRATPPTAKSGVAYLHIENKGNTDDTLVSVSSPAAGSTMVHETTVEDGVMKMSHVMALKIPAGQTVELKPSGLHVMLMGLKSPLKATESYKLTLTFQKAGEITIDVPILLPGKTLEHAH